MKKTDLIHLKLGRTCIEERKGVYLCRYIPFNTANKRFHWVVRNKWTEAWKAEVFGQWMLVRQTEPFALAKVKIVLHVVSLMDYDGAYSAVKPVLDGLKGRAIIDDSPKYIDLEVKQKKVAHLKDQFVEIFITPKYVQ